jgi:hypothetical protein
MSAPTTRRPSLASDSDKGPTGKGNHETELLAHMTTPEGMAVVAEEGLGPEVFETPLNRYAFTFALEYWDLYQKAPTREVFVTERPGLKLPEVDPEDDDPKYATGWLVKQLQKRYATNQVQEMVRAAVSTCVADPIGTIKKLAQVADEANRLVEGDKYTTAYDPLAVAAEVEKLRNRDLAKQLYAAEKNAELVLPPVVSLGALLAKPDTDTAYLIDELAPIGGRVLLSAQFKAGKSTVVGNLVRSLVDGDPFLGRFQVPNPVQRVVLIDNELSEATVQRWLRAQEIKNLDAVADVVTLRGKVNTFNILDDRTRTRWARRLSDLGADYLILDCLRPCLDALGLSEDKEAGRFLVAYDALLDEAGISDTTLVHHMGHNNERSRGDSRLQDWPDAIWKLVRESAELDSSRYFSAYGRDVEVTEGRLEYNNASRHLTYGEGSRTAKANQVDTEEVLGEVIEILVKQGPGEEMSRNAIRKAASSKYHRSARTIDPALLRGILGQGLTKRDGANKAHFYAIANPCSVCSYPVEDLFKTKHPDCGDDS